MYRLLRDVSVRSAEDRVVTSSARSLHLSISVLLESFANPFFHIQLDSANCDGEGVVMPIFAMARYRVFHDRVSSRERRATEMTRLRFRDSRRKQMTRRTNLRHRSSIERSSGSRSRSRGGKVRKALVHITSTSIILVPRSDQRRLHPRQTQPIV